MHRTHDLSYNLSDTHLASNLCGRNPRYMTHAHSRGVTYDNLSQQYHRDGPGPTAPEYLTHTLCYPWLAQELSKYYPRRVVSYHGATTIIELPRFTSALITSMHLILFKHGHTRNDP
jgi:hypothetical protein